MQGALDELPPIQEVNHHIPLIDEKKRYKYYPLKCLDLLKPELMEKIACYTCAGWWEPAQAEQAEQAAPMLCVKKKMNRLRTVIDERQCNNNMINHVTPLPDQDIICLDVARAKICSKIDLSDVRS